jgi:L-lactate dehydrogenase complex protein LldG
MNPSARSRVLDAVRAALARGPDAADTLAPAPGSDRPPAGVPGEELIAEFAAQVRALGGSVAVAPDGAACAAQIVEYLRDQKIASVAVHGSPCARQLAEKLTGVALLSASGAARAQLERADCALLEASALLADTGSAIVLCASYGDRLLPYLPRTCLIVSTVDRLFPSLCPQALACIDDAARKGLRGEAVIITGPSRTADIEKKLVLGAHGPAELAIFLR